MVDSLIIFTQQIGELDEMMKLVECHVKTTVQHDILEKPLEGSVIFFPADLRNIVLNCCGFRFHFPQGVL